MHGSAVCTISASPSPAFPSTGRIQWGSCNHGCLSQFHNSPVRQPRSWVSLTVLVAAANWLRIGIAHVHNAATAPRVTAFPKHATLCRLGHQAVELPVKCLIICTASRLADVVWCLLLTKLAPLHADKKRVLLQVLNVGGAQPLVRLERQQPVDDVSRIIREVIREGKLSVGHLLEREVLAPGFERRRSSQHLEDDAPKRP
mmetsp:Transcript_27778/g.82339  ORF Transcript_27778/g.82339 Transcript_27778/m.82339 type:complete len:201 (+) Transcript_27778:187-789(+)